MLVLVPVCLLAHSHSDSSNLFILHCTVSQKEKDLLEKVQFFANQLEQYRFDSQKALFAAKDSSKNKELQLKEEIRELRRRVNELDWERNKSKETTQKVTAQRDELRKEVKKLKVVSSINYLRTNIMCQSSMKSLLQNH